MRYSCGGFVDSSLPTSTRPGWVRQVSGVGIGELVEVMMVVETVAVLLIWGVEVGDKGVGEGTDCSDGKQAVMKVRSASRISVCFVA